MVLIYNHDTFSEIVSFENINNYKYGVLTTTDSLPKLTVETMVSATM